jgi:hypothetical protein
MKKKIYYLLALFFLAACSENKPNEEVKTSDSVTTSNTATVKEDTTETTVPNAEDSIKKSDAEFEELYSKVVKALRTPGSLNDVNNYLDPEQGLFILYNPGAAISCTLLKNTHDLDDSDGSPVIDFLEGFAEDMAKAKDGDLVLQYSDQTNAPLCEFSKRGTFVLTMNKPKPFLSKAYKDTQEMIGMETDQEMMRKLKDIEKNLSREVIINSFRKDGYKYGKVIYFTRKNNQWYFSGMNLVDCGAA